MKSPVPSKSDLNRLSEIELHALFNHASDIAFNENSTAPEKAIATASMEVIKRELLVRRP